MRKGKAPRMRKQGLAGLAGVLPVPVMQFDRAGLLVDANQAFLSLLGAQLNDAAGMRWLAYIEPADRSTVERTVAAATSAQQPFRLTCRVRAGDEGERSWELNAVPWTTGGRLQGFVAIVTDVTYRDASAQHARSLSQAFNGLAEHTSEMYLTVDRTGRIAHWNASLATFTGLDKGAAVGESLAGLAQSKDLADALGRAGNGRGVETLRGVLWPGRSIPLLCKIFPVGDGSGILLAPDREATGSPAYEALRASEDRLRHSEERYRAFIENSSEGIWRSALREPVPLDAAHEEQARMILDRAALAECNNTLARFCGRSQSSHLVRSPLAAIIQISDEQLAWVVKRFIAGGYRLDELEIMQRTAEGDIAYLLCSLSGVIDHGHLVQVWGTLKDVTEQRLAERRLRLLAQTLTSVRDAVSITDMDNRILFVNDAFVQTYGFPEEQLIGQDVGIVRPTNSPPALDAEIRTATLDGGWYGEVTNRRLDGTLFPVELWTSVVRNDDGDPVAMVGVAREITERKRTEENLRSSLREKEVLLKEIHHRVKNNLQVISSLLSLQAGYLKDDAMIRIIQESQNRVKSMALVHEKLYQSLNVAEIDFGDYLRELVAQLSRSYGSDRDRVRVSVVADPVSLGVDRAIPCGIIVNELVTNALKYAFPGERQGTIEVTLKSLSPGLLRLIVKDDGVGMPPGLDMHHAKSLGLTLVYMLAEQMQGELTLPASPTGVEFILVFRK